MREHLMKLRTTVLAISAAALSLGLMLAPRTSAQDKKDTMAKDEMKKDAMTKGEMKKDEMKKGDMKKDDMKKDEMKK
jgi:pentapeptide MXKDX repeat protein